MNFGDYRDQRKCVFAGWILLLLPKFPCFQPKNSTGPVCSLSNIATSFPGSSPSPPLKRERDDGRGREDHGKRLSYSCCSILHFSERYHTGLLGLRHSIEIQCTQKRVENVENGLTRDTFSQSLERVGILIALWFLFI